MIYIPLEYEYSQYEIDNFVRSIAPFVRTETTLEDRNIFVMKLSGKLTESQITKEVQIIDSNYNIDVYDTPDFNINDVDELAYQVFENNYYAYRIHVYINEYFVPEGAYIIDHGDLPPTKCYFDNIIEREQSLSKKIK